jgi:hypothetical protein
MILDPLLQAQMQYNAQILRLRFVLVMTVISFANVLDLPNFTPSV